LSREDRHRYTVSLVLTGRVAAEIDGMRRALGARSLHRIAPHVTLVPPVNVPPAGAGEVLDTLRAAAAASGPITVELGGPATFLPRTPVVYMAVGGDVGALDRLRLRCAAGPLAPPATRQERPFVPHVTIDQRATEERIALTLPALADYRDEFTFESVTLLEQDEHLVWHPAAVFALGPPAVVARGGLEVTLSLSDRLDPAEAAWAADLAPAPATFTVTARREGTLAGAATATVAGSTCTLTWIVVDPARRRQGIASHLLRALEDLAREQGCTVLQSDVLPEILLHDVLLARGFRAATAPRLARHLGPMAAP
jgi:2'-5' RNA ligase/L-amino acid N-acyltransferase YncA